MVIRWIIILSAYGYLIYRLVTFSDYQSLSLYFQNAGLLEYGCLLLALLLFPANISVEAIKWKYLINYTEPVTYRQALCQTYFGFVGGFFTPSRIGDYPARAVYISKENRVAAIGIGFIGSFALIFLHITAGLIACFFLSKNLPYKSAIITTSGICLVLILLFAVFYRQLFYFLSKVIKKESIRQPLVIMQQLTHRRFIVAIFFSFVRYLIYSFQLFLVLKFCSVSLSLTQALTLIPIYYMLLTVTPSVPVADVAIRGSWAMIVFSLVTDNSAAVAMAAVILWTINSILPMLVGSMIAYKGKSYYS